jgi:hypothetical protein
VQPDFAIGATISDRHGEMNRSFLARGKRRHPQFNAALSYNWTLVSSFPAFQLSSFPAFPRSTLNSDRLRPFGMDINLNQFRRFRKRPA